MEMFDVKEFINKVDVKRTCEGDDCEFEVTEHAMNLYCLKYPCYENWKKKPYADTIVNYLKSNQEQEIKKERSGYKGSHVLVDDSGDALTADILTSIGKPFKAITLNGNTDTGEGIKKYLCKDVNEKYIDERKEIIKYLKAFAYVYYWCGNMIPVVCNWKGAADEGIHKVNVLYETFDASETDVSDARAYFEKWMLGDSDITGRNVWVKVLYTGWINALWKERSVFFEDYYLSDFIKVDQNQKILVREDISLFDYKSLSNGDIINWLLINTKLIIQRSYRIQYKFTGKWNDSAKDEENVKSIMQYVFKQAGFNELEAKNLATIF